MFEMNSHDLFKSIRDGNKERNDDEEEEGKFFSGKNESVQWIYSFWHYLRHTELVEMRRWKNTKET